MTRPPELPAALLRLAGGATYLRYVAVSGAALAIDMGLFLLFLARDVPAIVGSALAYCAGIAVHWILSSRLIWAQQTRASGEGRERQKALFLASALAGLAVTTMIVALGELTDTDARIAKLIAIIVSFHLTYWLRRSLIFRAAA